MPAVTGAAARRISGHQSHTARAILLGLLQGPTEIAPISSSAHTSLARAMMGAEQDDPAMSKALDVALHGGSALALGVAMAGELRRSWGRLAANGANLACSGGEEQASAHQRRLAILALSLLLPSAAGYLFERSIEERLSGPKANAAGLALGAFAMAIAERSRANRTLEQANAADGVAAGIAQAAALIPGVSRRGATLTAARLRGMSRQDADELSWLTALPVILGACTLKAVRLRERKRGGERGGAAAGRTGELLAGAGASLLATLASARVMSGVGRVRLLWFAAYRLALAGFVVRSMRDNAR